jgi:hypothetical protein
MYEKIFPSRFNELENYFQSSHGRVFDGRAKSKSMNIHLDDILLADPSPD